MRVIFVAGIMKDMMLSVSACRVINPVDACCQGWEKASPPFCCQKHYARRYRRTHCPPTYLTPLYVASPQGKIAPVPGIGGERGGRWIKFTETGLVGGCVKFPRITQ